jgi:endoglucanase
MIKDAAWHQAHDRYSHATVTRRRRRPPAGVGRPPAGYRAAVERPPQASPTRPSRTGRPSLGAIAALLAAAVAACAPAGPATASYAPLRHPFRHATLWHDDATQAARWRQRYHATWLDPIVTAPQARWLTGPGDLADLDAVVPRAAARHELLVLVTYWIPDLDCAGGAAGAPDAAAYRAWTTALIGHLRGIRAVVVVEPDAVTADCFDAARAGLLADAVHRLSRAGHFVYLDAGNSNWRTPREMAPRLLAAGVAEAEGFAVNVASRESTRDSARYAVALSRLLGGREAVIDTSRNGLPPPPGDAWCNAEPQALGQRPSTAPGLDRVAALLWIKAPGESDGACGDGVAPGVFLPRQARTLIAASPFVPQAARRAALAAAPPPA